MARDPLETRGFRPTTPTDLNDPARFAHAVEATKDAIVEELRRFFNRAQTAERLQELPTIQKYAIGFGAGLDPFETTVAIIQELADQQERLPHIAVLAASGRTRRLSIGRPIMSAVQYPPRVQATVAQNYNIVPNAQLVLQTTPSGVPTVPVTSTIVFRSSRFSATNPISAARAQDVARVFNEVSLYSSARVAVNGAGQTVVEFVAGGLGGGRTARYNEIEVLSTSTPSLVAALGLGNTGSIPIAATITGAAPTMTLNVAGAGFTAAMIGRNVTITGAPSSVNNGSFPITAVPGTGAVTFTNAAGVAEAFAAQGSWFIGFRDTTRNPARPKMNRYGGLWDLTVQIEVLAEDPTIRRELTDLIMSFHAFWLEEQHFTFLGRTFFDEALPEEVYQISLHSEISGPADSNVARSGDPKDQIAIGRVQVPVTTLMCQDRAVTVLSGPSAGQSWTLESENINRDETLPQPG
jgi:hypothetical protein